MSYSGQVRNIPVKIFIYYSAHTKKKNEANLLKGYFWIISYVLNFSQINWKIRTLKNKKKLSLIITWLLSSLKNCNNLIIKKNL